MGADSLAQPVGLTHVEYLPLFVEKPVSAGGLREIAGEAQLLDDRA